MLINHRRTRHDFGVASLSRSAVEEYQQAVTHRHPLARWIAEDEFGRVVAGNLLLSLRFRLIDPLAQAMAWRDAASRMVMSPFRYLNHTADSNTDSATDDE